MYRQLYSQVRRLAAQENTRVYAFIGVNKTPTRAQLEAAIARHTARQEAQRRQNIYAEIFAAIDNMFQGNPEEIIYPSLDFARKLFQSGETFEKREEVINYFLEKMERYARNNNFQYAYVVFNLRYTNNTPVADRVANLNEPPKRTVIDLPAMVGMGGYLRSQPLNKIFSPALRLDNNTVQPISLRVIFRSPRNPQNLPQWNLGGTYERENVNLNCVIKTCVAQLPQEKANLLLEEYGHLQHTQDEWKPLTIKDIDTIGKAKKYGFSFRIFTPIGEALKKPTITCGRNQGRVIEMAATDNHAHMLFNAVANYVEYIPVDFQTTSIVDGYLESSEPPLPNIPELTGYGRVNNRRCYGFRDTVEETTPNGLFKKIKLMKFLKPSAITNNPEHDNDPRFFSCYTAASVFSKWFITNSDFHNTPEHIRETAKNAAVPFRHYDFSTEKQEATEFDHNSSYASYEFNEYYNGFPSGYYRTIGGEPQPEYAHLVAFIECSKVSPKPSYEHIYDIFTAVNPNMSAFTGPVYHFLKQYFDFEIIATTYAEHTKSSIQSLINDLSARVDLPTDAKKMYLKTLRNSAIGRLVIGGIHDSSNQITITTQSKEYADVLLDECGHNNLTHTYLNEGNTHVITAKIPEKARGKYIHVYAYIIGFSKIAIMKKIISDNLTPLAIRIDGIIVKKTEPIGSIEAGRFKAFYTQFIPKFRPETNIKFSNRPRPVSNPLPMIPLTIITGPPGTAKTHNIIQTAPASSLYLVHTKIMRGKQRADLMRARNIEEKQASAHVITVQKLAFNYRRMMAIKLALEDAKTFGPRREVIYEPKAKIYATAHTKTLSELYDLYKEYSRATRSIYSHCTEVYLDEFAACLYSDIQILVHVCKVKKLYLTFVGDYEQIHNQLANPKECIYQSREFNQPYIENAATPETLAALGFAEYIDPRTQRTPDNSKPHRHTYDYGNFLDTLRGRSIEEQITIAKASGLFKTADTCPEGIPLIAGTWAKIRDHCNKVKSDWVRARNIETGEKTVVRSNCPQLWKDKRRMADQPPKAAKLICAEAITVDSIQGETITEEYAIDINTMTRHGSFYTALTRAPHPSKIYLII